MQHPDCVTIERYVDTGGFFLTHLVYCQLFDMSKDSMPGEVSIARDSLIHGHGGTLISNARSYFNASLTVERDVFEDCCTWAHTCKLMIAGAVYVHFVSILLERMYMTGMPEK